MARWQVDSGIMMNSTFPGPSLTLPHGLDVHSTLAPPSFRVWSPTPATEDIIVLAEFSEIEGPVPLLTIPNSPSQQLDLNDFVVKILSTDYLNTSGEFRVYEDTQLVQQDLTPGVHVYVHYFTLFDVRARGFVRPMCLSYISADYRKLTRYFSQLRQHFILATEFLKLCNYDWFSKEIVGLIKNLEFTKDRYIVTQRLAADDDTTQRERSCGVGEEWQTDRAERLDSGGNVMTEGSPVVGRGFTETISSAYSTTTAIITLHTHDASNYLKPSTALQSDVKGELEGKERGAEGEKGSKENKTYQENKGENGREDKDMKNKEDEGEDKVIVESTKETTSEEEKIGNKAENMKTKKENDALNMEKSRNKVEDKNVEQVTLSYEELPFVRAMESQELKHDQETLAKKGSTDKIEEGENYVKDTTRKEGSPNKIESISPTSKGSERSEDEISLLRHTSLESVATQLLECRHILSVIKPHMDKKEIAEDINNLKDQILSKPKCPLYKAMKDLSMFDQPDQNAKPTICILSLMKRNFHNMRTVQQLCGFGYVACLFKLKFIFDKYCKAYSTLLFEDLDSDIYDHPFNSLFIGNTPIVRVSRGRSYHPSAPSTSYLGLCWDTHFIKFLRNGISNVSTPESEFSQAVDTPSGKPTVAAAADCLKVFSRSEDDDDDDNNTFVEAVQDVEEVDTAHQSSKLLDVQGATNPDQDGKVEESSSPKSVGKGAKGGSSSSSSSACTQDIMSSYEDIQEEEDVGEEVLAVLGQDVTPRYHIVSRMILSKVCRVSGLIQQFCGVSHCLLSSLLSGRMVILAGAETYRPMVTLYVRALATLMPHSPATHLQILRWHTGTVTDYHLKRYRVMGICIPERLHVQDLMSNATLNQATVLNIETGHISGVAYSGNLVRGVEQYGRRMFHSNSALQACLQSILISLGLKVYLLYHLLQTTDRSANDILRANGVVKGDWGIVTYLAGMIRSQARSLET